MPQVSRETYCLTIAVCEQYLVSCGHKQEQIWKYLAINSPPAAQKPWPLLSHTLLSGLLAPKRDKRRSQIQRELAELQTPNSPGTLQTPAPKPHIA